MQSYNHCWRCQSDIYDVKELLQGYENLIHCFGTIHQFQETIQRFIRWREYCNLDQELTDIFTPRIRANMRVPFYLQHAYRNLTSPLFQRTGSVSQWLHKRKAERLGKRWYHPPTTKWVFAGIDSSDL